MDALHSSDNNLSTLEKTYAATTARVRRFLSSRYPLHICVSSSLDYPAPERSWREVWEIEVDDLESSQRLLLAVPNTFPDALPSVYLPVNIAEAIGTIPHLDRHRSLCTFDRSIAGSNSDRPEEIALEILDRAAHILKSGRQKANNQAFAEEVNAYWEDVGDGKPSSALSLILPSSPRRKIILLLLQPTWRGYGRLFVETPEEGRAWLHAVGYQGKATFIEALHLRLEDFGLPPFPATNRELFRCLQERAPEALKSLVTFLRISPRPAWVLASIPAGGEYTSVAWGHPPFTRRRFTQAGYRDLAEPIPGFRPTHQPAQLELSHLNANARLHKSRVSSVHKDRLLKRTTGVSMTALEMPVNVLGCGSVGGFVAEGLARSGYVRNLRLADDEVLTPENTFRHLCGMSEVGKPKAVAVASHIRAHFPNMSSQIQIGDVLDLLRRDAGVFLPTALTVVAIGNTPVERRLNRLCFESGTGMAFPICFVWVEPHLYGGHALYLANEANGCLECLLDECLRFQQRVVQRPEVYTAREAGCQSSFVPYSGMDLMQFTSVCTRFMLRCVTDNKASSLLSWTGDLDQARIMGVTLTDEYSAQPSFSTMIRPLKKSISCPVCNV